MSFYNQEELLNKKESNKDRNIHNLYLFVLSHFQTDDSVNKLLSYLEIQYAQKKTNFDVEYAAKIFSQFKQKEAQVFALALRDEMEAAVDLALEMNRDDLAKKVTKRVIDDKMKKKLWMKIFVKYLSESDDLSKCIQIIRSSGQISMDDVMLHIRDDVRIESFKNEIFDCFREYDAKIKKLNKECLLCAETSEVIEKNAKQVNNKHITLDKTSFYCDVCGMKIGSYDIFIFPCGHFFDKVES